MGSLLQSSSLATLDYQSHILVRFARAVGQSEFVKRYGDRGEDEFSPQGGTIPQRLLMMNGELLKKKTEGNLVGNAATQIAALASTDEKAIETAYLACLTRRPTADETAHFAERLAGTRGMERRRADGRHVLGVGEQHGVLMEPLDEPRSIAGRPASWVPPRWPPRAG